MMDATVFLDSNILVYAINKKSPYYTSARTIVDTVNKGELRVCLSPQVLGEFYAVITNPWKLERNLSPQEAAGVIERFLLSDAVVKVYPKKSTLKLTLELVKHYQIMALKSFDAQIVATMLDNGVTTIYTVNEDDFAIFEEIKVVNPFKQT
jgi:predicted nucleic acid-binding protein